MIISIYIKTLPPNRSSSSSNINNVNDTLLSILNLERFSKSITSL